MTDLLSTLNLQQLVVPTLNTTHLDHILQEIIKRLATQQAAIDGLTTENSALRDRQKSLTSTVEQLQHDKGNTPAAALVTAPAVTAQQFQALQDQLTALQIQFNAYVAVNNSKATPTPDNTHSSTIAALTEQLNYLGEQVRTLQSQFLGLSMGVNSHNEGLEELQSEREVMQQRMKALEEQIATLNEQLLSISRAAPAPAATPVGSSSDASHRELELRVASIEQQLKALHDAQTHELQSMRSSNDDALQKLRAQVGTHAAAPVVVETTSSDFSSLVPAIETLQQRLQQCEALVLQYGEQQPVMQKQLQTHSTQLNELQVSVDGNNQKLAIVDSNVSAVTAMAKTHEGDINALRQQLSNLLAQHKTAAGPATTTSTVSIIDPSILTRLTKVEGRVDTVSSRTVCNACNNERATSQCAATKQLYCQQCDAKQLKDDSHYKSLPIWQPYSAETTAHQSVPQQPAITRHITPDNVPSELSALRTYLADQLERLHRSTATTRIDIQDLYNKVNDLSKSIKATDNRSVQSSQLVSDLLQNFDALKGDIHNTLNSTNFTTKAYVDREILQVANQRKQHETKVDQKLKHELQRFEGDLVQYLQQWDQHTQNDAAAAKITFRCISCDQSTRSVSGPASLLFNRSVQPQPGQPPVYEDHPQATQMLIDKGQDLYLYSTADDKFYKGKDKSQLYVKPQQIEQASDKPTPNSRFNVQYINDRSNAYGNDGTVSYVPPVTNDTNMTNVVSSPTNITVTQPALQSKKVVVERPLSAVMYSTQTKLLTAQPSNNENRPQTSAGHFPLMQSTIPPPATSRTAKNAKRL